MNQVSGSLSAIAFVMCTVLLINLLHAAVLLPDSLTEAPFSASGDIGRGVLFCFVF